MIKKIAHLWCLLVFITSIWPIEKTSLSLNEVVNNYDFSFHFFSYFILTGLYLWSFHRWKISYVLILLYGLLIEGVQHVLPYRGFEISDLFFNWLGITLMTIVYIFWRRRREKFPTQWFKN